MQCCPRAEEDQNSLRIEVSLRENGSVFPPSPHYSRCPDSGVLDVSVTSSGSITFSWRVMRVCYVPTPRVDKIIERKTSCESQLGIKPRIWPIRHLYCCWTMDDSWFVGTAHEITNRLADSRRALLLACVATLAVLTATLWPMNSFPPNGVTWSKSRNGLQFEKKGLVLSKQPLDFRLGDMNSYTIELALTPTDSHSSRTILGFYVRGRTKQLLIKQYHDGLLITHNGSIKNDSTGAIKVDVDHVFRPGELVCIAISSAPNGTTVYVDGQRADTFPAFTISGTELLGNIVLGTSPINYDPWRGAIQGLAIYAKRLTAADAKEHWQNWTLHDRSPDLNAAITRYTFNGRVGSELHNEVPSGPDLAIPKRFSVPYKAFLASPAAEFEPGWRHAVDVLMNVGGFIPLGLIVFSFFSFSRSSTRAMVLGTFFCAALSCLIEILQYYVPSRGSGITDIITNTLGGAIGSALPRIGWVHSYLRRMRLMPD
jgi:VanZ family protein